ncbi:MAG: hypothetical protein LKF49_07965 [Bifidobacterium tibiigranuli]|uniref:hypothetical protein n=1 Tax=Bifidobacterium tibiigranuli TaxID=2172043 RepID=UPI002352AE2C|nr:hypothetical protein [Bifidobacterium tibiigranuli]MCH3975514.1 hypothetical protein [Bifidobacterium tibiigranuli]MCH4204127.1 hypothetical protein [Bifidobacterium tibiigranuli]MCH4274676.1 hypothetical protein [Bifidobacterium tibiigranuli]MCI1649371.1 hypothetical protein [Bifidobacterium tibiigranuli]MCI1672983.1 hypothetical protein [Bifidobacterium tibiigranuli]
MRILSGLTGVVGVVGFALSVYQQIQYGYFADEHPEQVSAFTAAQSSMTWLFMALFLAIAVMSVILFARSFVSVRNQRIASPVVTRRS